MITDYKVVSKELVVHEDR